MQPREPSLHGCVGEAMYRSEALILPKATANPTPEKTAHMPAKQGVGHYDIIMGDGNDGHDQKSGTSEAVPASSNTSRKRKARTLKPADWDNHKETIRSLFVDQNKTLDEVRENLMSQHNFTASIRQYKSQIKNWKLEKNVKAEEMAKMVQIQSRRRLDGKETLFRVRGVDVPSKKIERWLKRPTPTPHSKEASGEVEVSTPPEIDYRTPATTPRDSGCVLNESESVDDSTPHVIQDGLLQDSNKLCNSPGAFQMDFTEPFPEIMINVPDNETQTARSPWFKDDSQYNFLQPGLYFGDERDNNIATPSIKTEDFKLSPLDPKARHQKHASCRSLAKSSISSATRDVESEDSQEALSSNKRPKIEADRQEILFSCPFRKRNPLRFNARDFGPCSKTGFSTISEVKRHIRGFHAGDSKGRNRCPRCLETFDLELALHQHMQNEPVCELKATGPPSFNPEDGISDEVSKILIDRNYNTKSWEELWKVLFPDTSEIPDPDFEPIVEMYEVEQSLLAGLEDLKLDIRAKAEIFRQRLGLHPTALDELSGMMVAAVEEFTENQLARCKYQRKLDANSTKPRSRSRTNSSLPKQAPTPEIRVSSDPNQTEETLPQQPTLTRTSRTNSVKSIRSARTQDSRKTNRLLVPNTTSPLGPDYLSPLDYPSSATSITAAWTPYSSSDLTDLSSFSTGTFEFSSPVELDSVSSSVDPLTTPWSHLSLTSNSPSDVGGYSSLQMDPQSNDGPKFNLPIHSTSMTSFDLQPGLDTYPLTARLHHTPCPPYIGEGSESDAQLLPPGNEYVNSQGSASLLDSLDVTMQQNPQ